MLLLLFDKAYCSDHLVDVHEGMHEGMHESRRSKKRHVFSQVDRPHLLEHPRPCGNELIPSCRLVSLHSSTDSLFHTAPFWLTAGDMT